MTLAFTLLELVVVIAVIAILGAVSVAAYMGVINSAHKSADQQVIDQMNTVLTLDKYLNEADEENEMSVSDVSSSSSTSTKSIEEVREIFENEGINSKYKPVTSSYKFYYVPAVNMMGISENEKFIYPNNEELLAESVSNALRLNGYKITLSGNVTTADSLESGSYVEAESTIELVIPSDSKITIKGETTNITLEEGSEKYSFVMPYENIDVSSIEVVKKAKIIINKNYSEIKVEGIDETAEYKVGTSLEFSILGLTDDRKIEKVTFNNDTLTPNNEKYSLTVQEGNNSLYIQVSTPKVSGGNSEPVENPDLPSNTDDSISKCNYYAEVRNLGSENCSDVTVNIRKGNFENLSFNKSRNITYNSTSYDLLKITPFYKYFYVTDGQITGFDIADRPINGFYPYSCFVDGNGNVRDYIEISSSLYKNGYGSINNTLNTLQKNFNETLNTGDGFYAFYNYDVASFINDLLICKFNKINIEPNLLKEAFGIKLGEYENTNGTITPDSIYIFGVYNIILNGKNKRVYCSNVEKYSKEPITNGVLNDGYQVLYETNLKKNYMSSGDSYTRSVATKLGYNNKYPFINLPVSNSSKDLLNDSSEIKTKYYSDVCAIRISNSKSFSAVSRKYYVSTTNKWPGINSLFTSISGSYCSSFIMFYPN